MFRFHQCLQRVALFGTLIAVVLAAVSTVGGCLKVQEGFDSPSPSKRMDAIAQSAQQDDQESRVLLVEILSSTDQTERMLAIRALEKREGTTLDYDHAAPQWERIEAIERWRDYIGLSDEMNDEGLETGGVESVDAVDD